MIHKEDYIEPGNYNRYASAGGFIIGLLLLSVFLLVYQYYFAHTNIAITSSQFLPLIILTVITFVEIGIIYYIRNRKKDLAAYSQGEFDSTGGCWLLIALILCLFYINSILFCEINGRFDPFDGTKRKIKIVNKTRKGNTRGPTLIYRHYLIIEDWDNNGSEFYLQVPESVYNKFNSKDMIEFETKPGLLGFEHIASEIKASK